MTGADDGGERQRRLPSLRRRHQRVVDEHISPPSASNTTSIPTHRQNALVACYEEHIWPRIYQSLVHPVSQKLHHEVELGATISSQCVVGSVGAASGGNSQGTGQGSLLSGFIRKLQTPACSTLGHLMPTALSNAIQGYNNILCDEPHDEPTLVVVLEDFVTYRIQHINKIYTLTQRKRTDLNTTTQQRTPTKVEWKCKYHVELHGIDHRIQVAREYHFDEDVGPGVGANSVRLRDVDEISPQGQTLLQNCIRLGLVDMRTDDPHMVELLSEGQRVLLIWALPSMPNRGHPWRIEVRLNMDVANACTPCRVLQCLRSARSAGGNSLSIDAITRSLGATLCEWRVELEFDEIISAQDFNHGVTVLEAFVRTTSRQMDNEHFHASLQNIKRTCKGDTICHVASRFLAEMVANNHRVGDGAAGVSWIPVAVSKDLLPTHREFLCSIRSNNVFRAQTIPGPCDDLTQNRQQAPADMPYPRQPRPKDATLGAWRQLAAGQALLTTKLDGAEGFLLGTRLGLLMVTRTGWMVHTPWPTAITPTKIPFLFEGEFLTQQRAFSCYDALLLPCGWVTTLPYRRRIGNLQGFLRRHKPVICDGGAYQVCTKPFYAYSAFPLRATLECFRWMQRTQVAADGFIVVCGSRSYWKQCILKVKFWPSVDFLFKAHPELPKGYYQMMLRERRGTSVVYCSLTHSHGHGVPYVVDTTASPVEGTYDQRVSEAHVTFCTTERRWDIAFGQLRESNKEPNYLFNIQSLLTDNYERAQMGETAVQRVFGTRTTGDIKRLTQACKWNYCMGTIHGAWVALRDRCTQFVIIEVGGGNGGDIQKWLTLVKEKQHPLVCIHVIEPNEASLVVYKGRLFALPGILHHTVTVTTLEADGCDGVCVRHQQEGWTLTFWLHGCAFADWSPTKPPPAGTGVCAVFNFSIAQIVSSRDEFRRLLHRLLPRPVDHMVGVLHSYDDTSEVTRAWSNGLVWKDYEDEKTMPVGTFRRTHLTVEGTKLAHSITEWMVDIQQLVDEARECGYVMHAEPLVPCSGSRHRLHWLLLGLHGFVIHHRTSLLPLFLHPLRPTPHSVAASKEVSQSARDAVVVDDVAQNRGGVVLVVVPGNSKHHVFTYATPGAVLLRYLGQSPTCGPFSLLMQAKHPRLPLLLPVESWTSRLWKVACVWFDDRDDDCDGRWFCTDIGFVVACTCAVMI